MFDNEATSFVNTVSAGKEIPERTTEDSFMQQVESHTAFKIATIIDIYWFPILVPIGLVGNTYLFCDDETQQQENVNLYLHGSY